MGKGQLSVTDRIHSWLQPVATNQPNLKTERKKSRRRSRANRSKKSHFLRLILFREHRFIPPKFFQNTLLLSCWARLRLGSTDGWEARHSCCCGSCSPNTPAAVVIAASAVGSCSASSWSGRPPQMLLRQVFGWPAGRVPPPKPLGSTS